MYSYFPSCMACLTTYTSFSGTYCICQAAPAPATVCDQPLNAPATWTELYFFPFAGKTNVRRLHGSVAHAPPTQDACWSSHCASDWQAPLDDGPPSKDGKRRSLTVLLYSRRLSRRSLLHPVIKRTSPAALMRSAEERCFPLP